jgi:hypothetical protein
MQLEPEPEPEPEPELHSEPEPELLPAADASVKKSVLMVLPGGLYDAGHPAKLSVEAASLPELKALLRKKVGIDETQPIDILLAGERADRRMTVLRDIQALPPKARVVLQSAEIEVELSWDLGSRLPHIRVDDSESIEVGVTRKHANTQTHTKPVCSLLLHARQNEAAATTSSPAAASPDHTHARTRAGCQGQDLPKD